MGILANWGLAALPIPARTKALRAIQWHALDFQVPGRGHYRLSIQCLRRSASAVNQFGSGTNDPILVDWSRSFNYDANSGVLAAAASIQGEC